MPRDADADEWLAYAREDLAAAHSDLSPRIRCFHAQQAAEKGIKAVLVAHGIEFPWVHSIEHLVGLLPGEVDATDVQGAYDLTTYAAAERYPRPGRAYSDQVVAEAVHAADEVVAWAIYVLVDRPSP